MPDIKKLVDACQKAADFYDAVQTGVFSDIPPAWLREQLHDALASAELREYRVTWVGLGQDNSSPVFAYPEEPHKFIIEAQVPTEHRIESRVIGSWESL